MTVSVPVYFYLSYLFIYMENYNSKESKFIKWLIEQMGIVYCGLWAGGRNVTDMLRSLNLLWNKHEMVLFFLSQCSQQTLRQMCKF